MNWPQVAGQILTGFGDLAQLREKFQFALEQLNRLASGESIDRRETDPWRRLVDEYERLAVAVRNSPDPTQFDPSPYRVSAGELSNCATRPSVINRLRGHLRELSQAQQRGNHAIGQINNTLDQLSISHGVLNEMIRVGATIESPILEAFMPFSWLFLETRVRPALNNLVDEYKDQLRKLQDGVYSVQRSHSNLTSWLSQLERLACPPPGKYKFNGCGEFHVTIAEENSQLVWSIDEFEMSTSPVVVNPVTGEARFYWDEWRYTGYFGNLAEHLAETIDSDNEDEFSARGLNENMVILNVVYEPNEEEMGSPVELRFMRALP